MGHDGPWKRLGDGTLPTEDADDGLGHVLDLSYYNKTLGFLLVMTILTVYTAKYVDLGSANIILAFVIATTKALAVALFFMHLKFERKLVIMFAMYPLIVLFLLIGGTMMDVAEREGIAASSLKDVKTSFSEFPEGRDKSATAGHHDSGHH